MGVFAFASPLGVLALLEEPQFKEFLEKAEFELVVGVDSITTKAALTLLKKQAQKHENLTVRAFLHATEVTFHPKFCWFTNAEGGEVVVGSGNLTPGGLKNNWEAFSRAKLSNDEAREVEDEWQAWKVLHADRLLEVDNAEVIKRASKNSLKRISVPAADRGTSKKSRGLGEEVLIAEIGGPGRWKQANFPIKFFEGFFQLDRSKQRRVLLWHVESEGTAGKVEDRPSIAVKSQNYRLELGAASGKPYPDAADGRPIAVFLRVGRREFRYRLLFPTDKQYKRVAAILSKRYEGNVKHLSRITMSADELRKAWKGCPL